MYFYCIIKPNKCGIYEDVADGLAEARKSIFTSFIDFGAETTGNPLKKRIILSKNIIETVTLHYHFSKIDFRVAEGKSLALSHF